MKLIFFLQGQSEVTVYFQPESKGFSGATGYFHVDDLIFFDDENSEKIYEGDSVLINCHGNQYIPGTVVKKEYIYGKLLDCIFLLAVNNCSDL